MWPRSNRATRGRAVLAIDSMSPCHTGQMIMTSSDAPAGYRPADVCRALLAALDASDGRRRKRKRDQTADAFGLAVKRDLLQRVVDDDPPSHAFEEWLFNYPATCKRLELAGPARAMARAVF